MATRIFTATVLVVLLLSAAVTAQAADATAASTSEAAPTEQATEPEPGDLRFVHDAEGAPALGVELAAPDGAALGTWVVEPRTAVNLGADDPLLPGTYPLTVTSRDGTEIVSFDVAVSSGFTTVVTAYADQHGRLLFAVLTADGEEWIRPVFEGTLVVRYDLDDGPTVEVVVWPLEREDKAFPLGRLAPGDTLDATLEAGPHTLLLYVDDQEVGRTAVFVVDDETTVVRVSEILEEAQHSPATTPGGATDDQSSGVDFPVPERVETGRTSDGTWPPATIAALTVFALFGALAYALGRTTR
jgi:hypothetical protein